MLYRFGLLTPLCRLTMFAQKGWSADICGELICESGVPLRCSESWQDLPLAARRGPRGRQCNVEHVLRVPEVRFASSRELERQQDSELWRRGHACLVERGRPTGRDRTARTR